MDGGIGFSIPFIPIIGIAEILKNKPYDIIVAFYDVIRTKNYFFSADRACTISK